MPMPRRALVRVLHEVAVRNRLRDGLLYMQVTRGVAPRDHAFPTHPVPPALVITSRRIAGYPADIDRWTATAITHPDERWARCDIKSVGLLANVLAKQAARQAGAAEAILVDADGHVTEGRVHHRLDRGPARHPADPAVGPRDPAGLHQGWRCWRCCACPTCAWNNAPSPRRSCTGHGRRSLPAPPVS